MAETSKVFCHYHLFKYRNKDAFWSFSPLLCAIPHGPHIEDSWFLSLHLHFRLWFSPSSHSHSTQIHHSTVGSLDLLVLFSPIHRNFCFRLLWRRKNKNGTEVEAVKMAVEYSCRKLLRVVRWTTGRWVYQFCPIFLIHADSLRVKGLSDFLHNLDRRSLRFLV